ncbi:MAG: hypothetical protein ABEI39_00460 [Halobacteriales archaeon]
MGIRERGVDVAIGVVSGAIVSYGPDALARLIADLAASLGVFLAGVLVGVGALLLLGSLLVLALSGLGALPWRSPGREAPEVGLRRPARELLSATDDLAADAVDRAGDVLQDDPTLRRAREAEDPDARLAVLEDLSGALADADAPERREAVDAARGLLSRALDVRERTGAFLEERSRTTAADLESAIEEFRVGLGAAGDVLDPDDCERLREALERVSERFEARRDRPVVGADRASRPWLPLPLGLVGAVIGALPGVHPLAPVVGALLGVAAGRALT